MISEHIGTEVTYVIFYTLAISSNLLSIIYFLLHGVQSFIDRFFFSLSLLDLVLVAVGIPFTYALWIGEDYKYGPVGCQGVAPLLSIVDFSEGFLFAVTCVLVAKRLRRDVKLNRNVYTYLLCIYVSSVIMAALYFGAVQFVPNTTIQQGNHTGSLNSDKVISESQQFYCVEDWNRNTGIIYRVTKVLLQFFGPMCVLVYYNRKSFRIAKCILRYLHVRITNKNANDYQSLSDSINNQSTKKFSVVFTESEEINLHCSGFDCDEDIIMEDEVKITNITPDMFLWRGKAPQGGNHPHSERNYELQNMIVSKRWFSYMHNIFKVFLAVSLLHIFSVLPMQCLMLYTTYKSPYDFAGNEKVLSKVVFCWRFIPTLLNPWWFLFGVRKYRRGMVNMLKCCPAPLKFKILQDASEESL